MRSLQTYIALALLYAGLSQCTPSKYSIRSSPVCRNKPLNTSTSPTTDDWNSLNSQVDGRLLNFIPSAEYCREVGCTDFEWQDSVFRSTIPGAMEQYNWEQDYHSNPPSLCLWNGTTTACGQGDVPIYGINATTVEHIQAGVNFAVQYNLRVAVKASGHDLLGRSTAKDSLLLWTHNFRNITFTDSFLVGTTNEGSAVTVGSGFPMNELYSATKAQGQFVIGATASTVVAAGGYVQGAGHSVFSPALGLAADNALEFSIVIANGELVTANAIENPDREFEKFTELNNHTLLVFWALRGGGAGSWGVIISATFRTFPIFNATEHNVIIFTGDHNSTGNFAEIHARHIFDWDEYQAGQYFYFWNGFTGSDYVNVTTYFANLTGAEAEAAMKPFLDDAVNSGYQISSETTITALANDLIYEPYDSEGVNLLLGSRLVPAQAYKTNVTGIGQAYTSMLNLGNQGISGNLVAGGKVSENANVNNSVTPKWRTAKAHVIVQNAWDDNTTVAEVLAIANELTNVTMPILASMTGETNSGAYSNEADPNEPDFQTVFFGDNYAALLQVKAEYDPNALFIVDRGVGSEEWDSYGFCRV